jgi:hypothetical protein
MLVARQGRRHRARPSYLLERRQRAQCIRKLVTIPPSFELLKHNCFGVHLCAAPTLLQVRLLQSPRSTELDAASAAASAVPRASSLLPSSRLSCACACARTPRPRVACAVCAALAPRAPPARSPRHALVRCRGVRPPARAVPPVPGPPRARALFLLFESSRLLLNAPCTLLAPALRGTLCPAAS